MRYITGLLFLFLLAARMYPQWTERQLPQPVDVWGLASSDSLLFAGTEIGFMQPGYVFRSSDNGVSWDTLTGVPFAGGWCLVETDSVLVAGSFGWGMYLSYDQGDTWTVPDSGIAPDENIHTIIKHKTYLFAATAGFGNGIFRSSDDGKHWISVNGGLTELAFLSLASNDADIYAGTAFTGEVFRSIDDGINWFLTGSGIPADAILASLAASGTNVYAGSGLGEGVYYSSDNGLNWTNISTSAFTGEVWTIILTDTNLFVGTIGSGIYLTQDNGTTWSTVNEGLMNSDIRSLMVSPDNYIYAGTTNGFVYYRPLSELTGVAGNNSQPSEYRLYQNYPNPFNPGTKIQYSIPRSSKVQIKVYDVLGNKIATLINEEKPAGNYELTWNAANLPSGIFFYELKAGHFIQTKKMILLK